MAERVRCEALSRLPHPLSDQCTRCAKEQVRGHWYCVEHARIYPELWETHDRIVSRIRHLVRRSDILT